MKVTTPTQHSSGSRTEVILASQKLTTTGHREPNKYFRCMGETLTLYLLKPWRWAWLK